MELLFCLGWFATLLGSLGEANPGKENWHVGVPGTRWYVAGTLHFVLVLLVVCLSDRRLCNDDVFLWKVDDMILRIVC
jgi:hypothetical protein